MELAAQDHDLRDTLETVAITVAATTPPIPNGE